MNTTALPTASRLAFIPAVLAAGLLLAGCAGSADTAARPVSGHIEATEVRIAAKVGGRVTRLAVREGDEVKPGQAIATIDTTETQLALAAARADRAAAAADLALKQHGARQEDIAEARANVANVEADLAGAQRDLERMQGLLDSGSGTTKSRDDAQTRRDVLAQRLAAARQSLARLERGFRAEEIDAAKARLAGADARIAQLEQQATDAVVTSPVAGIVTEKAAEEGELLGPGTLIAVVTDIGDPWLTVYVAEPDLARIRLGQPVDVRTDAGDRRTGQITYISSTAEFTPKNVQTRDERVKLVFKVKVGLPNADGLFKPGMPAEAVIGAAARS